MAWTVQVCTQGRKVTFSNIFVGDRVEACRIFRETVPALGAHQYATLLAPNSKRMSGSMVVAQERGSNSV